MLDWQVISNQPTGFVSIVSWLTSALGYTSKFVANYCLFIAEYVEQGALFDFLHQNDFNSDRNLMWARQIAAGEYM